MVEIYLAGLIEAAGKTGVGGTWVLDRAKVTIDLGITDRHFDELQPLIEARMPGRWSKIATASRTHFVYKRIE